MDVDVPDHPTSSGDPFLVRDPLDLSVRMGQIGHPDYFEFIIQADSDVSGVVQDLSENGGEHVAVVKVHDPLDLHLLIELGHGCSLGCSGGVVD